MTRSAPSLERGRRDVEQRDRRHIARRRADHQIDDVAQHDVAPGESLVRAQRRAREPAAGERPERALERHPVRRQVGRKASRVVGVEAIDVSVSSLSPASARHAARRSAKTSSTSTPALRSRSA